MYSESLDNAQWNVERKREGIVETLKRMRVGQELEQDTLLDVSLTLLTWPGGFDDSERAEANTRTAAAGTYGCSSTQL